MSLYLGDQLVSGSVTPTFDPLNIGQMIQSTLPLSDARLHLLDGSLIQGNGMYDDFVSYIAQLHTGNPNASYFAPDYITFVQPTLTNNGTMGVSAFATTTDVTLYSIDYLYQLFMPGTSPSPFHSVQGTTTGSISWYCENPLKITNIKVTNQQDAGGANRASSAGTIYGSNDGTNWTSIKSYTNAEQAAYAEWNINLSDNTNYYKYYKWTSTAGGSGGYWTIANIVLTASENITGEKYWQQQVSKYGVCGKFVYDSTNNTVRLPKITGIVEGAANSDTLGNITEAGLPNITGSISSFFYSNAAQSQSGALSYTNVGTLTGNDGSGSWTGANISLNASNSNSTFGKSSTVQPQTIKVFYYVVIATAVKTQVEADIDEIATDLNGKADIDLNNVAHTSGFRKLIETYWDGGNNWYKVYEEYNPSNGNYIGKWCEQGGRVLTGSGSPYTVNLLKPMSDANYQIFITLIADSTNSQYWGGNVFDATTTSFKKNQYSNFFAPFFWTVKGYLPNN